MVVRIPAGDITNLHYNLHIYDEINGTLDGTKRAFIALVVKKWIFQ